VQLILEFIELDLVFILVLHGYLVVFRKRVVLVLHFKGGLYAYLVVLDSGLDTVFPILDLRLYPFFPNVSLNLHPFVLLRILAQLV
jgi:hypothetical protein